MLRIHIVGSGRSGTTLFHQMMKAGFEIEGHCPFEMKVLREPKGEFRSYCSKRPRDLYYIGSVIDLNPDLWVICVERDPRDVIVSRHKSRPDEYWIGLPSWKRCYRATRKLLGHPRFRLVRYEDLVRRPDAIQDELASWMPFLARKHRFSEFHTVVQPEQQSEDALGGVRPVSENSIGAWRRHKPRVAGEIRLNGPITAELVEMGCEKDDAWLKELEGVEPDLRPSVNEQPPPPWRRFRKWLRFQIRRRQYARRHRRRESGAAVPPG